MYRLNIKIVLSEFDARGTYPTKVREVADSDVTIQFPLPADGEPSMSLFLRDQLEQMFEFGRLTVAAEQDKPESSGD